MKILILNGPNINFLGIREKSIYGTLTYNEFELQLQNFAQDKNFELIIKQSNH